MQTETKTRSGRPPEADRHQVATVALRLLERKGFEAVTMDEIATAAGVSRRTLFRLFPSKKDLVWDGLKEVLGKVKSQAFAHGGAPSSPLQVVEKLFVPILQELEGPETAKLAQRRLRLIATTPALLNNEALVEVQEIIAAMLAQGKVKGEGPPSLVARSLVSVAFGALLWWSEQAGQWTALEAVRAAFHAVSRIGASSNLTLPQP